MKGYKFPDLQERQGTAAAAKKTLLEKFRAAQQDPAVAEKHAARKAAHDVRQARIAEREAARKAREAELAAQAAREAELAEKARREQEHLETQVTRPCPIDHERSREIVDRRTTRWCRVGQSDALHC